MKVNPSYLLIAKDIALKISKGIYKENDKIKGRTLLAGEYNVSPETIRKAINILANEKIVLVKQGVGIFVISSDTATKFLSKLGDEENRKKQISDLNDLIEQRNKLNEDIFNQLNKMLKSDKLIADLDLEFKEVIVDDDSWVINQTIGDVYFYNYTEATIVAIIRGNRLIASPGPDFTFIAQDKLIIVGKDKLSYDRVLTYLKYGAME